MMCGMSVVVYRTQFRNRQRIKRKFNNSKFAFFKLTKKKSHPFLTTKALWLNIFLDLEQTN